MMPEHVLRFVLAQIAKLAVHDKELRTKLVLSGSFGRIQELQFGAENETKELIDKINKTYPSEILSFYSVNKYRVYECKPNPIYTARDPRKQCIGWKRRSSIHHALHELQFHSKVFGSSCTN